MLQKIKRSATFADLADNVDTRAHETDTWPRCPHPTWQARGEVQYELKILRVMKAGLKRAIADGDRYKIASWKRSRAHSTIAMFLARERLHRPGRYLRPII